MWQQPPESRFARLHGLFVARATRGETRQAVEAAAQKLGYAPNMAARALRTGQSTMVLALVADLDELQVEKVLQQSRCCAKLAMPSPCASFAPMMR